MASKTVVPTSVSIKTLTKVAVVLAFVIVIEHAGETSGVASLRAQQRHDQSIIKQTIANYDTTSTSPKADAQP